MTYSSCDGSFTPESVAAVFDVIAWHHRAYPPPDFETRCHLLAEKRAADRKHRPIHASPTGKKALRMTTFIETGVALADIAKSMKIPIAHIEAEAHELDVFIGVDWTGRPAVSVTDAHGLVSGTTRRDHDHAVAWRAHQAASEAWETAREGLRAGAFQEAHDAALRKGRGAPAAASVGHEAAREAVRDLERRTPPPEFNGKSTSTRWLAQTTQKIKELI